MKNIVFLLLLALPCVAQKKATPAPHPATNTQAAAKYELKGVVSYFFNKNYGYKPDVGAITYIIKDGVIPKDSLDAGAAEAYRSKSLIYSLSTDSEKPLLPGEDTPKSKYEAARNRADRLEARLRVNPASSKATADGQGVFAKKLKPGAYWVLIVSEGRHMMQMQKVVIVDDDVEVSAKFNEYSL